MPFKKFGPNDLFYNRIRTCPSVEFFINSGSAYYNRNVSKAPNIPDGHISLHEINVDRTGNQLIYPFVTKDGTLSQFKTISLDSFSQFNYGDEISGSYPLTASISSDPFLQGQSRPYVDVLRNTLNHYKTVSPHYAFSSSLGDKGDQEIRLISIPSIFYGSSIKKGTVSLKFYLSGTLIGELKDKNRNGDLIETTGQQTGSIAGSVLYKEGFILLTGSWSMHPTYTDDFNIYSPGNVSPAWKYFGTTGSAPSFTVPSSSFQLAFSGTNYIPTVTMFAHAEGGEFNYSNNPTFIQYGQEDKLLPISGNLGYYESNSIKIKNMINTAYNETSASFEKVTYISKIGIYDDNKNLIGIAKLATPVRKSESDSYSFKLKLDF